MKLDRSTIMKHACQLRKAGIPWGKAQKRAWQLARQKQERGNKIIEELIDGLYADSMDQLFDDMLPTLTEEQKREMEIREENSPLNQLRKMNLELAN